MAELMSQTARRSPAHSAHLGVAMHQPTKHKPAQEGETAFPLPQQATLPCTHMARIPKATCSLCVWPTSQGSVEKLRVPFAVVCCPPIRGRKKMYSHLFQFRDKQHPWELRCTTQQVLPSLAQILALSLLERETEDKMSLNHLKIKIKIDCLQPLF